MDYFFSFFVFGVGCFRGFFGLGFSCLLCVGIIMSLFGFFRFIFGSIFFLGFVFGVYLVEGEYFYVFFGVFRFWVIFVIKSFREWFCFVFYVF